jgi:predicted ATPase/class 3 adenylate cyclase
MTAVAPAGVVTFLFTDVEGSTRRWEADAGAMRKALAAHDELLRSAIEARGGWLFKHTGDGVVAAFASPMSAVDAAVAAQRSLELPVRMGLATGEAELRDGDYFGAVLNRAARVMAAGHGGQILLADSTAVLVSGVDLLDLGPRRLRDVPMPVGMFQVRASGLRAEFPPLRALDTSPGNLRRAATSFIGRASAIAELELTVRKHRLVTLTGVGGVGKTRLALETAAHLANEFPDGVWVFELAAVTDPAAVPDAVSAVLGIIQQAGKSVSESVATALEGRVRLLVFDNCEHVLDAAADLIDAVLAHSATVTILATSREGLGVADEHLWPVPSLDVGAGIGSAAVELFVERAQAVSPGFSVANADEAAAVVEICGRLDGIPLAIELAASRMASMTVSEVRDRLDHRFRLLVGSRRGLARHQTLHHAVAWSYDLLDDAEKELLDRCSVFAGGFDLESACAVGGSVDPDDFVVLDLLDALVRKSLLVADRSAGRTRFSMWETIRQFAEEKLVARGEATEARDAHARYFAGRENAILPVWDSPRQREAYDWFATELANLRAAFRWAADHDDLDVAAPIATCAAFLGFWVEQFEPVAWAEELIERARAVDHPRLAQLYAMATQCYAAGRLDDALAYANAFRLAIDNDRFEPVPYDFEGWCGGPYIWTGVPERWLELCRNRIARGRDTGYFAQANLVVALTFTGAVEEGLAASEGVIAAAEATHNPVVICYAVIAYGYPRRDTDPAMARECFRRGLAIARESGNRQLESHLAGNLSLVALAQGDLLDAFDHLVRAIRNHCDSGSFSLLLTPLTALAAVLDRLGRHQPAATIMGFANTPFTRGSFPEMNDLVAHLRDDLGDRTYEALARKGESMTAAAIAAYACDEIDRARAELKATSNGPEAMT